MRQHKTLPAHLLPIVLCSQMLLHGHKKARPEDETRLCALFGCLNTLDPPIQLTDWTLVIHAYHIPDSFCSVPPLGVLHPEPALAPGAMSSFTRLVLDPLLAIPKGQGKQNLCWSMHVTPWSDPKRKSPPTLSERAMPKQIPAAKGGLPQVLGVMTPPVQNSRPCGSELLDMDHLQPSNGL